VTKTINSSCAFSTSYTTIATSAPFTVLAFETPLALSAITAFPIYRDVTMKIHFQYVFIIFDINKRITIHVCYR